jgi:hypothetical protein
MIQEKVVGRVFGAFRQALGRVIRAGVVGLLLGTALVEGLAIFFNKTAGDVSGITWAWPPEFNLSAPTAFVHTIAIIFGLLMGYLLAFTVAVMQTLRGVFFAAEHVDDVAGAALNKGLDLADAAVDAVDGPDRHGFRGKRGPVVMPPLTEQR